MNIMFVQTQKTPNPNSLKFLPGKKVSMSGPYEITKKEDSSNKLVRNILSINGVTQIFLAEDYLSVNKDEKTEWNDLKHIIISFINDHYSKGNEIIIDSNKTRVSEIELSEISPGKSSRYRIRHRRPVLLARHLLELSATWFLNVRRMLLRRQEDLFGQTARRLKG